MAERTIYNTGCLSLLPRPLANDKTIKAVAKAFDEQMIAISKEIGKVAIWSRIQLQPDEVLDLMAWERSVDFWDDEVLSDEDRWLLLMMSGVLHSRKGTRTGIKNLMEYLPDDVELITQSEAKQLYWRVGGRTLDGTWKLDGTQKLVDWGKTGLPKLDHWAMMCVKTNADNKGKQKIRQILKATKRLSTWLVWMQSEQGEVEAHPEPGCFRVIGRVSDCETWATPRLDGTWILDGSVLLGARDVVIYGGIQQ